MLLSLDEKCLNYLCEFLCIEDQIELSRVCKFLQDYFENNLWKCRCKHICLESFFWDAKENEKYLPKFMRIVAETVEHITFGPEHIKQYGSLLNDFNFSKMKSCAICLDEDHERDNRDQMFQITKMFPNLKKLHVEGSISGHYISLLKELESLHLVFHENNISTEQYAEIYSLPKLKYITFVDVTGCPSRISEAVKSAKSCPTLDAILFQEDVFSQGIINSLKEIKNLQTIQICTSGNLTKISNNIEKIEKHFGEAIDTLLFQTIDIFSKSGYKILKLKSLRCIIFYKTLLEMNDFAKLCRQLPENLEEFCFLYCSAEENECAASKFIPLLKNCAHLRILDLSGNHITENFVVEISKEINVHKRKQPLVLRCFQTKITKQHLENIELPDSLQVTLSERKYSFDRLESEYFQVDLNRAKISQEHIEEEEEEADYEDSDCENQTPFHKLMNIMGERFL